MKKIAIIAIIAIFVFVVANITLCGDLTFSFSGSRSGTCSHHGGVISWFLRS